MSEKRVIWQNYNIDVCEDPLDEGESLESAIDLNWVYLEEERLNLNIDLPGWIIMIGTIETWDGKVYGYCIKPADNLSDCLEFMKDCDLAEWYVQDGEFQARQSHHDGTNHVIYRLLPFKAKADGLTLGELWEVTKSLAPYVCKVYGWNEKSESAG